jgi:hypothetical protein
VPIPIPGSGGPLTPGVIPTGIVSYLLGSLLVPNNYVDAMGVRWGIDYIDGLDGLGDTGDVEQYPADHGGWALPAYYKPRELEVLGWLVSPHWSFTSTAVNQLKAALPIQSLTDLVVSVPGEPDRLMRVRQQGKPLFKREGRHCQYSLSLVAPDPRMYSTDETVESTGLASSVGGLTLPFSLPFTIPAVTTSGVLTVTNEGDESTPQMLKVTGPCPPFTLRHNSGRTLSYGEAVPAGRFLLLDVSRKQALLDGVAARFVSGSWFEYAPGVNTVTFEASTYDAGALLTSTHRSAWK